MVNNESGQLMLIINPISGTGNKKGVARMVEQRFAALACVGGVAMPPGWRVKPWTMATGGCLHVAATAQ